MLLICNILPVIFIIELSNCAIFQEEEMLLKVIK